MHRWCRSSFCEGNHLSDTMLKFSELQFKTSSTSCLVLSKIIIFGWCRLTTWCRLTRWFLCCQDQFQVQRQVSPFLSFPCLQWKIPRILQRIHDQTFTIWRISSCMKTRGDRLWGTTLGWKKKKKIFFSGSSSKNESNPIRIGYCDQQDLASLLWQPPKWRESQSQSSSSIRCWRNLDSRVYRKTQGHHLDASQELKETMKRRVDAIVSMPMPMPMPMPMHQCSDVEKKKECGFSSFFLFFFSSHSSFRPLLPLSAPCCSRAMSYLQSWFWFAPQGKQKKKKEEKEKKKRCFGFQRVT